VLTKSRSKYLRYGPKLRAQDVLDQTVYRIQTVEVDEGLSALDACGKHVLLVDTVLDSGRTLPDLAKCQRP